MTQSGGEKDAAIAAATLALSAQLERKEKVSNIMTCYYNVMTCIS